MSLLHIKFNKEPKKSKQSLTPNIINCKLLFFQILINSNIRFYNKY